jgi:hypothetical protein
VAIDEREQDESHGGDGGVKQIQSPQQEGNRRGVLHPRGVVRWATVLRVRQSFGPKIPGGVADGNGEPPKVRRELKSRAWRS